ncbi:MAG: efflux RND transporter periplasmic adaptor subunit [Desulfobacterales bacterium]|uniref:Efflux RND transporter periplasmic adaptor subunit n=1 Tax=Candidatus Desulfatibia vada TaxID=2841696 RepID=A0A8J6NWX4_9BACT|nr:efflux RND transporter periplasmic adaptor subunit [Candidatus Desulfatibia vada]MBL6970534.1 efflux RND transporter periplasmic adaptor subunit [Desulfobacterales bacterium]
MPIDRPTFSESWYRVVDLTPRLVVAVKVHRQHFRSRVWYVLQDPANDHFFRLSRAAYHFVAMLDGRRTVGHVWKVCAEQFGDDAPTQSEVIKLLGQLYTSNLLQGNLAPDAKTLFKQYDKRVSREVRSVLMNFLFMRVPLFDPDAFLGLWVGLIGRLFTWYGVLIWAGIVATGLWTAAGHIDGLTRRMSGVLSPENLPLLYLGLVIVKVFHEFGHAFACKHFGRQGGTGGEVHTMGVMFMVFTPFPFVDASSAWGLRSKWHRVVVSASGMLVELVIASMAAILWSSVTEGTTIHTLAYNIMIIASVSTLLFNGNPLLQYDAYYILSDILEIPNLSMRSRQYIYYLVKRYVWGVRNAHDPSHTRGEKRWLAFYAVVSTLYRVIVFAAIILFVGDRLFVIGILLAAALLSGWVLVPVGNVIRYLATSAEIARVRERAVLTTLLAVVAILAAIGMVNAPDRCRIEGVVEPVHLAVVHAQTAGFVRSFLSSASKVTADGPVLIETSSPELEAKRSKLLAGLRKLDVSRHLAQTREASKVQIIDEEISALKEQIERVEKDRRGLKLRSPISGTWVAPAIDQTLGTYVDRGKRTGIVAGLEDLRIRAIAGQDVAALLIKEANPDVEMKLRGRPEIELAGRIETILPAGNERLPSKALGYAAGGAIQIDKKDPSGKRAVERFFEILVAPSFKEETVLRPGQVVVLRFETAPKPLLAMGWRALLQLFQRRFHI